MDAEAKGRLAAAFKSAKAPALVRTAFDLPAAQRATVQNAINETLSAAVELRFETAPELIGGIELTIGGQKVSWSIADYLTSMGQSVAELLSKPAATERVTSTQ
jgi:F-type H+-transporting ATPase subunit b